MLYQNLQRRVCGEKLACDDIVLVKPTYLQASHNPKRDYKIFEIWACLVVTDLVTGAYNDKKKYLRYSKMLSNLRN